MRKLRFFVFAAILFSLVAFPASALAAPNHVPSRDDVVVFGNDYVLRTGETVTGSIIVFGGDVTIEANAIVTRDVVTFGGSVQSNGSVGGSIIALGGDVELGPTAVVTGDVVTPGGELIRQEGAQIQGNTFTQSPEFAFPRDRDQNFDFDRGFNRWDRGTGQGILWLLFNAFAMSTVALLVALFLPNQLRRIATTILEAPVVSGGLGLLSLILLPIILVITLITIIGPFIIGFIAVAAAALGWIALGLEVGRRMSAGLKTEWSPLVQAWLGTLVLSFVGGLLGWVPCIGWLGQVLLGSLGLGGVLLTRFGMRSYPESGARSNELPAKKKRKRASK